MTRITASRRSKYNAKPVVIDGIRFASTKEGNRYRELKLLEKAGHIARLTLQRRFELCAPKTDLVGDVHDMPSKMVVGYYVADFCYDELTPHATQFVVEDVKSPATRTALFIWKAKHMKAQYGITIRET